MTNAKKKEILVLFLERRTFKLIIREEAPNDSNILRGRFFLAVKSTEDGQIKFRARYVIVGHRDKLKNLMVRSAITFQPQSIRLLLKFSALHDFDVWTSDVTKT